MALTPAQRDFVHFLARLDVARYRRERESIPVVERQRTARKPRRLAPAKSAG